MANSHQIEARQKLKKDALASQRKASHEASSKKTSDEGEANETDSKKKPRVNDSLLLDNFLIKKKEEPVRQTLHRALLDFQSPHSSQASKMKN